MENNPNVPNHQPVNVYPVYVCCIPIKLVQGMNMLINVGCIHVISIWTGWFWNPNVGPSCDFKSQQCWFQFCKRCDGCIWICCIFVKQCRMLLSKKIVKHVSCTAVHKSSKKQTKHRFMWKIGPHKIWGLIIMVPIRIAFLVYSILHVQTCPRGSGPWLLQLLPVWLF